MTIIFNPQLENSPLNDVRDAIDSGAGNGRIRIFDGATLIASLNFSAESFADESGGESIANQISPSASIVGGTVDSFTFENSQGGIVLSGSIPDDLNLISDTGGQTIDAGTLIVIDGYTQVAGVTQAREFASTIEYPYT